MSIPAETSTVSADTKHVVTPGKSTSNPGTAVSSVVSEPKKPESTISGTFGKASIDAIRENIRNQEKARAESRKELTTESIQSVWDEYTESCTSKSVQMALQHTQFEIKNTTIQVFVPNQVTKDMVLQETNLLDRLRDELVVPGLTFVVEIDISRFPDYEENKFVPVLSQKDKYLVMTQKNPQIEHLIQKFALKLDTGN